jgi:hypothetical protein
MSIRRKDEDLECEDEVLKKNSIIVTIAVQTHGAISQTSTSPETMHLFDNVRLFSKAGQTQEAVSNRVIDNNTLPALNTRLQKDIPIGQTTLSIIEQYAKELKEKYVNFLDFQDISEYQVKREKTCLLYPHITVDKVFYIGPYTNYQHVLDCINMNTKVGIFLISIHEKDVESGQLKCIYPSIDEKKKQNKNLQLDIVDQLKEFASIFGKKDFTFPENKSRIESITMSELVKLIKNIVGYDRCFINILDYSCSNLSSKLSRSELRDLKYFTTGDIETGYIKTTGGRKRIKSKSKRIYKSNLKKRRNKKKTRRKRH